MDQATYHAPADNEAKKTVEIVVHVSDSLEDQ